MTLRKRRQSGFTLIEILIVAALISLLAGIAAINIQRAYLDNQRKATYGEARNIATAMAFCFQDTGVYPKLCFLHHNSFFIAPPDTPPYTQPGALVLSGFEYIGYDVNLAATMVRRIVDNWGGRGSLGAPGYFGSPGGRRGMFQGQRGGLVKMEIPTANYQTVVLPTNQALPIYDWPADPWGRPYVVYMLYQDGVNADGTPRVNFLDRPTRAPNYALAVVSYGPNGIPGGPSDYTAADVAMGQQLWLFSRNTVNPASANLRALEPSEYSQPDFEGDGVSNRIQVWSYEKLGGGDPNVYPGIIDKGSDDIVISFY